MAGTMKYRENLVKNVPRWFNGKKEGFFLGKRIMDIQLAAYMEERTPFTRQWIDRGAQHSNDYVKLVFTELKNSRYYKGGWNNLIGEYWWQDYGKSTVES